jgi:hypothetical protein
LSKNKNKTKNEIEDDLSDDNIENKNDIQIDFYGNKKAAKPDGNEKTVNGHKSDSKKPVDQYDYNLGTNTKMVLDFTNSDAAEEKEQDHEE